MASISVESIVRGLFANFRDEGSGSGFIIRPDGHIVTNEHVIRGAREIMVNLPNGETYQASVVGADQVADIAVIKINARDLPTATLADSDHLRVGDWVMTIGNALALKGGPTVTLGIVSGLNRTIRTEGNQEFYALIQTDATINDGNSGGPLVDMQGNVVGVNQALLREERMGFAVSANVAKPLIDSLIEHGKVLRPAIGFAGRDMTPAIANELNLRIDEGVLVTFMSRGGPAYGAGMRVGDIMTKMDGVPTPDVESWLNLLWSYQAGDKVVVEYLHDDETLTATVELAERDLE